MTLGLRLGLIGLTACAMARSGRAQPASPQTITYRTSSGGPLTLDYYQASGNGLHPAVILIHGGGSSQNDEEVYLARVLASAGYAAFSINYRLVEDVERAVRFVRQEARVFEIDAAHLALLGRGAGGTMAGLAALKPDAAVQAVIAIAAVSDLRGGESAVKDPDGIRALEEASVVMHLRANAPPFLLIHGDSDKTVDLSQSTHLQTALHSAGVACDLIIIRGGGHSMEDWFSLPHLRGWEHEMVNWLNELMEHTGRPSGVLRRDPA
ncbi:MAG: prolyl oligopeptidase family serine peptidase [Acidobacteriia bacterium]|nr:prolyl oligopeptidase family serine peptidase [Terriglobia bacterium]